MLFAYQMDLLEQNTEKSCLLTLEHIQRLSPIAANLISLEVHRMCACSFLSESWMQPTTATRGDWGLMFYETFMQHDVNNCLRLYLTRTQLNNHFALCFIPTGHPG